jgi:hypothetical protein
METSKLPKNPRALNPVQQKQANQLIQEHLYIVFNGPCKRFPHYPFAWKESESSVYLTAIIEHFEEDQQHALAQRCNIKLKQMNFSGSLPIWASECLKARTLRRHGGGIQFKLRSCLSEKDFTEIMREYDRANLWEHVKNLNDLIDHCQIRFHIKPFGQTTAKVVSFKAYSGVPIVLMMWVLRQLECNKSRDLCGFGQVIVIQRNGLPDAGDDHDLHYKSGMIYWE